MIYKVRNIEKGSLSYILINDRKEGYKNSAKPYLYTITNF